MPTLNEIYELETRQSILEALSRPELIREVIDSHDIETVENDLEALTTLLGSDPAFKKLTLLQRALSQAAEELFSALEKGPQRRWQTLFLVKSLENVGKASALKDSLTRALKQLPRLVKVLDTALDTKLEIGLPIDEQIKSSATYERAASLFTKALKPEGFRDLPYVNSEDVARQFLSLSPDELNRLGLAAGKLNVRKAVSDKEMSQIQQATRDPQRATLSKVLKVGQPKAPAAATQQKQQGTAKPTLSLAKLERKIGSIYEETWKDIFNRHEFPNEKQRTTPRELLHRDEVSKQIADVIRRYVEQHGINVE